MERVRAMRESCCVFKSGKLEVEEVGAHRIRGSIVLA